jgi:hypothetical protein
MSFNPRRPGESVDQYTQRVATAFVGVNEQHETEVLIATLAQRHGLDLDNDTFALNRSSPCGETQPCDGAILACLCSKLLWMLQTVARR